jgi:flagellar basal body-associated protein FliL
MAEETTKEVQGSEAAPSKKKGLKTMLILAGVLVLEAATVVVTFMVSGGPKPAAAEHNSALIIDDSKKEAEELVIQDRFPNSRRGENYLYDTEIYLVTRRQHQPKVQEKLKAMSATIHAEIATVFRRADPSYMHEDDLQTLSRQIKGVLDEKFGKDADGEPIVLRVVITRCVEYRIDF